MQLEFFRKLGNINPERALRGSQWRRRRLKRLNQRERDDKRCSKARERGSKNAERMRGECPRGGLIGREDLENREVEVVKVGGEG